jgi:hypothetical protein
MEELIKELNNIYRGCEFVRKSKYGRVKGVVGSVFITQEFIMDEDSEKKIIFHVNHSPKGDKTMEKPKLKGEEIYMAFKPKFHVESTKGVVYDFEECYFLNVEE